MARHKKRSARRPRQARESTSYSSSWSKPVTQLVRQQLIAGTASTQVYAASITPLNLGSVAVSVSDNYQQFRVKRIAVHYDKNNTRSLVVGYCPTIPTNNPTWDEIVNCPVFGIINEFSKTSFVVPRSQLPTMWSRRGTGFDDLLETAGALFLAWSDGTHFDASPVYAVLEVVFEFRGFINPLLTAPFSGQPLVVRNESKSKDPDTKSEDLVLVGSETLEERVATLADEVSCLARMLGAVQTSASTNRVAKVVDATASSTPRQ